MLTLSTLHSDPKHPPFLPQPPQAPSSPRALSIPIPSTLHSDPKHSPFPPQPPQAPSKSTLSTPDSHLSTLHRDPALSSPTLPPQAPSAPTLSFLLCPGTFLTRGFTWGSLWCGTSVPRESGTVPGTFPQLPAAPVPKLGQSQRPHLALWLPKSHPSKVPYSPAPARGQGRQIHPALAPPSLCHIPGAHRTHICGGKGPRYRSGHGKTPECPRVLISPNQGN